MAAADVIDVAPAQTGEAQPRGLSQEAFAKCCTKHSTVCKAFIHSGTHIPVTKLSGDETGQGGQTAPNIQMRNQRPREEL